MTCLHRRRISGVAFVLLTLLLFAIAGRPGSAVAQERHALHGRVIDARKGSALDGAEVSIETDSRSARSGTDGAWRLDAIVSGEHHIRVRRMGYITARQTVRVTPGRDSAVLVALVPSPRLLDAVVTTAARRAQRLVDVTAATEVVSREEIEASGASDVAAVLTEQTGVQFTGGHPSGAGVALEGLGDQRVLVLVDGLPLYGRIAGGLDVSRIPTSVVERIEVVKGPQSTLYGSEAMGGVVNVITRGAAAGPPNMELRTLVGSSRRSDTDLLATLRRGILGATANVGHRFAERTPGIAGAAGALTDRVDGLATVRLAPSAAIALDAGALVVNERQRWPIGTQYGFADNTQVNARAGATWTSDAVRAAATLSLAQLEHLSRTSQYPTPIAGTGDRQRQRLSQGDLLASWRAGGVTFDAGSQLRQERISSTDGRIAGGDRTLTSAEPYAQAEWTTARWSVVPGARLAWSEQWGHFLTPRIAVRVHADSSLTLRASAGRGFRAPDFKELYLDFTNDAALYAVHGNPALRPEHVDNVSLGAEWERERLYGRVHLYWNELHDFIETRALPPAGSFAQFTYGNVERGTTRGIEAESGLTLGAARVQGGYAFLHARDYTTGSALLGQPAHSGRVSIRGPAPLGVAITATGIHTGPTPMQRASDGTVASMRDAYTRLDLRVARLVAGRATLSAGVDNVFDARPARWADAVARQVYAALSWRMRSVAD